MLDEVYLELNKVSKNPGIYCILNIINNKIYIGSTNNLLRRKADHRRNLRANTHVNKHLQYSWDKYGESNFKFIVMEECGVEDILSKEQYYLDKYKSYNREIGYNKSLTAKGHTVVPRTHCKNNHELSGHNLTLKGGARLCKKCRNDQRRSVYIKVKTRKIIPAREFCSHGHKMTEENTGHRNRSNNQNSRYCKICHTAYCRKYNTTHRKSV